MRHVDTDLFWIVLQRTIPAEVAPALHLFQPDSAWLLPIDELVRRYFEVAAFMCEALEPIVAHHSIIGEPVIIEGCWLLPSFAAKATFADHAIRGGMRPLFLHDASPSGVEERIAGRPQSWFRQQPRRIQENVVATQVGYGQEIQRQARELDMPVLASRPFESLAQRAVNVLKLPPS